jgi:hypothetical protein
MEKADNIFSTVELDEPIIRGDTQIDRITLRRPKSGELRGLSMVDIVKLEADAIIKLVPRISDPVLTEADMVELTPADMFLLSTEIANFLLPKAQRVDFLNP